jgi:hypothetical protein
MWPNATDTAENVAKCNRYSRQCGQMQQIQQTMGQMLNAKLHNKYGVKNPKDNRAGYMVVWWTL